MTEKGYVTQSDDSREFSEHHTEQLEVEEPKPKIVLSVCLDKKHWLQFQISQW